MQSSFFRPVGHSRIRTLTNTAVLNPQPRCSLRTKPNARASHTRSSLVRWGALLLLVLAWITAPSAASAQSSDVRPESYTRGLYVDGMLGGSTVSYDESDGVDPGILFTGRIGYGFTDLFGIFVEFGGGGYSRKQDFSRSLYEEDYVAGFFDLGAQFNIRSGKQWVPYAEISLNGFAAGDEFENGLSGGGFTVGGGVKYYITDAWALNGRVQLAGHELDTAEVRGQRLDDVNEAATTTRFAFGLTWYVLR